MSNRLIQIGSFLSFAILALFLLPSVSGIQSVKIKTKGSIKIEELASKFHHQSSVKVSDNQFEGGGDGGSKLYSLPIPKTGTEIAQTYAQLCLKTNPGEVNGRNHNPFYILYCSLKINMNSFS